MADLVGRNKNFFALLADLSDSDSETTQEPAKKPDTKPAKSAAPSQPKAAQPKAVQPKQQKPKQTQHSTQPLNPLPSLPLDQDKKPERPTQSRKQERPKKEGAAPAEDKPNTQGDHKRSSR
mmetsp:Transcript_13493/g.25396  ORF Transcript_13493/g.25396 Transcript_13493/m.25396 type:complete len:121 (+) Transcript_13493:349-711(+)